MAGAEGAEKEGGAEEGEKKGDEEEGVEEEKGVGSDLSVEESGEGAE